MKIWNELSPKKKAFFTGTLLLTGTGFLCRILGFFYRIYLSRTIGAEGLGLFNLIHPIYGICFALCAGSIQTALSQCIASNTSRGRSFFRCGTCIGLFLSFLSAGLISTHADFLAHHILMEPRAAAWLPWMGLSIPFAALHSCINGYYYGMQKSHVPAFSQTAEQVLRMIFVYFLVSWMTARHSQMHVGLAVLGHLAGEIGAAVFTLLCLLVFPPHKPNHAIISNSPCYSEDFINELLSCLKPLAAMALPLMGNRLILNLLASAEAILIPSRLQLYGLSSADALSLYGVLTGMSMPFILFPSAISNSMAVLLLPGVAQAQAAGNRTSIVNSITLSLRYSLYMGILCIGVFTLFGHDIGVYVFHNSSAGSFIQILAWLCPFLYLATTLGSILNGLGQTRTTFLLSTLAMLIRLSFVFIGIPRYGIHAWLTGTLITELLLALFNLLMLRRKVSFSWNASDMIIKPSIFMILSIGIYHALEAAVYFLVNRTAVPVHALLSLFSLPPFFITIGQIFLLSLLYIGMLLSYHCTRKR